MACRLSATMLQSRRTEAPSKQDQVGDLVVVVCRGADNPLYATNSLRLLQEEKIYKVYFTPPGNVFKPVVSHMQATH